jgi:hypothetical protein
MTVLEDRIELIGTLTPEGQLLMALAPGPTRRRHHWRNPRLAEMARIAKMVGAEMYAPTYSASTTTKFTSTAAVQTVVGVASTATDYGIALLGFRIGYDASAAATGVQLRLGSCTFATNPPGTASTSVTIVQTSGRTIASTNFTAGVNWTTEPTVKTYLGGGLILQPFGGSLDDQSPSDRIMDTFASGAQGLFMEHNPPAAVGTTGEIIFSRI